MIKICKTKISFELMYIGEPNIDSDCDRLETIYVDLDWNNGLSIRTMRDKKEFVFDKSNPDLVKKIGRLLIEAGNLSTKYKEILTSADLIKD